MYGTERRTELVKKQMRKQRKRIWAALLSICMVLSSISVPVTAAETEKTAGSGELAGEYCPQGSVSGNETASVSGNEAAALNGLSVSVLAASGVAEVATAAELTSAISKASYETVKLMSDITINTTLNVSRTVTLDLNGYVLKYDSSSDGHVIFVDRGTLTIQNSDYTKSHNFTVDSNGLWVLDEENGTQSISGGIITGGHHTYGGGVDMSSSDAAVIMNGGAIVGCKADSTGGGVYAVNFTMNTRASIVGCTAGRKGGGVFADKAFTMNYQSRIRDCIAAEGAGVYVESSGNFIMNGGDITTCNATKRGGGVYIGNTFTMNRNSSIDNCTVSGGGSSGALYVRDNRSVCTLNGGAIGNRNSEKHNRDGIVNNGTINGTAGARSEAIYGKVINESTGTIGSGNYKGTVQNNNGSIIGGSFTTVSGKLIITFDPDNGEKTFKQEVTWKISGKMLTEPSAVPTKEGYTFAGWYYDNNGTNTKWDFGSDKAKYTMTLSARWNVTEQFSLVPGGTYYFDLSETDFPGVKSDSLPDPTFCWVPFTYAGTINAYVLNSNSSKVTGASQAASATTDSSAQYGYTYNHSLFIADHVLNIWDGWIALNKRGMIFGKDYESRGVNYTLRAPSAGSTAGNGRGFPQNNEWDMILDKDDSYIKNWGYPYSHGQDTCAEYVLQNARAHRGESSARGWNHETYTTAVPRLGFRPVLEVQNPDTLGIDGLKTVEIGLNGGTIGGAAGTVNIVTKNGENFTAPRGNGLTRPAGNTDAYFWWLGSDGTPYVSGAEVPSSVTALTAQWTALTYAVTLNANGGTIADGKDMTGYIYGVGATLPTAEDMTRTGYIFKGWYEDSGFLGSPVTEISNTDVGARKFYAKWEAKTYAVDVSATPVEGGVVSGGGMYHENDFVNVTATPGSGYQFVKWVENGSVVSTDASYSFAVAGSRALIAVFEKTGSNGTTHTHTWGAWISNGNGTHTRICAGDSSHTETLNCSGGTATCQSRAICVICAQPYGDKDLNNHACGTTYTLTFDTNGGSSIKETSATSCRTIPLSDYKPTRDGYSFTGWYSDKELTQKITEIQLNGSRTIYAGWTRNDPDPGTEADPSDDVGTDDRTDSDVTPDNEKELLPAGGTGTGSDTGGSAGTKEAAATFKSPQTGDTGHMGFWLLSILAFFTGIVVLKIRRRRKGNSIL